MARVNTLLFALIAKVMAAILREVCHRFSGMDYWNGLLEWTTGMPLNLATKIQYGCEIQ